MLLPSTSKINIDGHLMVGGIDVISLGQDYGTPLYIIDIATIKRQCREYIKNFSFAGLDSEIIYASKAFISTAMCQLIKDQDLSIDVSTGGELYIAMKSGFDPAKVYFHGNNKSTDEIEYGLDPSDDTDASNVDISSVGYTNIEVYINSYANIGNAGI